MPKQTFAPSVWNETYFYLHLLSARYNTLYKVHIYSCSTIPLQENALSQGEEKHRIQLSINSIFIMYAPSVSFRTIPKSSSIQAC